VSVWNGKKSEMEKFPNSCC